MWKPPAPASSPRSASWRKPAGSSFAAMLEEASLSRVLREPAFGASPLVVAVNSRDLQLLMGGLAGRPGVSVIEDATLEPGEARVRGPWALAELTRDALWSSVGEALGLGETNRSRKIL